MWNVLTNQSTNEPYGNKYTPYRIWQSILQSSDRNEIMQALKEEDRDKVIAMVNRLNEINKSITAIEKKQNEIKAELGNLNAELVDTLLTLELLEADLERKQQEIDEAQAEYERVKKLEEDQYHAMKYRIRFMYEKEETSYIQMLLEAESITDFLNKADFVRYISEYDDEKLDEYQDTREMVAETKAVLEEYRAEYEKTKELTAEQKVILEEEQAELEEVQEAQQIYKADLDKKIAAAKTKATDFETELANAQAKAKEYQNTIKEQNAKIKKLQEEEEKRLRAETATREEASAETNNSVNSGNAGGNQSSNTSSGSATTATGSGNGAAIANYALQFVGNPYVYGGTSLTNGADCSGFTQSVHKHFGISIPRSSSGQANAGKNVSLSAIQAGDVIYYGGHVGIYIGGGKIVHASTAKTGIKISNYTYRTPICARRYW